MIVRKNVQDSVPKAIMHFLVNYVRASFFMDFLNFAVSSGTSRGWGTVTQALEGLTCHTPRIDHESETFGE